ncbi:MAG: arginine--tRNA ligase [Pirellulales bacterium]
MNTISILRQRFSHALAALLDEPADSAAVCELVDMVRRSQDAKFGDYQANCAMPLGKRLGRPPRDVATELVERLDIDDLCEPAEIAGPGFINLRLRDAALVDALAAAVADERLGVVPAERPRTFVIDYSAPNVAKPMHVGHIRSTVIGDSLSRTLRFLGHRVVTDNHVGDWGTQFGMILFGYKNFRDEAAYQASPVAELARLYRLVNQLVGYHAAVARLPEARAEAERLQASAAAAQQAPVSADKKEAKQQKKELQKLRSQADDQAKVVAALEATIASVEGDPQLRRLAAEYPDVGARALAETAKLHAGDAENLRLWHEFVPLCLEDIERIYRRLGVTFDETLGESFYHERLPGVVASLRERGLATDSDGAVCVFLDGFDTPMIVEKQDGAFLYATTDLATIAYRMERWSPDAILYVVDHRQSLHFEQLFATVRLWGFDGVELEHVGFGTVMDTSGKPYKTRSGDTVGLESLLDEAVQRALKIVSENDDAKPGGATLDAATRAQVAETVGIAALKYADLSQNRESDYVFSYDKMLAMNGNTATYMQYAYARVRSIFARGEVDVDALRASGAGVSLEEPAERALALEILRFSEALDAVVADYRPNQLTAYLFDLAGRYSTFFEQCPVLKAPDTATRNSRLLLCDLTARTIAQGLELLGIRVVEKM